VRWLVEVHVALRQGISDPEGQTIGSVGNVRTGKLIRVPFEAEDSATAEAVVAEMCQRLLANPVMETASWDLRADEQQGAEEAVPS
jgi:phosphoribosylformylglycinamidine synthase